jgi:TolB-like protein/Flp pilus assembly protein TadD
MSALAQPASAERLDSWKEIAGYLKRGARTVQRWEREEKLPVHRLVHQKLGSVYAFRSELDAWWKSRRAHLESEEAPAASAPQSIAVLPFADMSREQDQGFFCEGIAEEIISALAAVRELRVASRSVSFPLRGQSASEIGKQLRVQTLLEGSVRKLAGSVRIAVQLVNVESGFHLWSERYDREAADIFGIQDEIARSVAHSLQITLSGAEESAMRKPRTKDPGAYEFYLRGREFYYHYSPSGIEYAVQMFVRAIEIDPSYAAAWAGLADCWSFLYLYSDRSDAVREQAAWASARALELNPESAQAHASHGVALALEGRASEATAAFETALRFDPDLFEAHYFYARHRFSLGDFEGAAVHYQGAMRARDDDFQAPLHLAQTYDDLGRPEEAAVARTHGIGRAEQYARLHPDDVRPVYLLARAWAAAGETDRARRTAERALAARPADAMTLYNVGCVYALLGLFDESLMHLEKAAQAGITQTAWYTHDSYLNRLRSDPRFQAILSAL